MQQHFTYDELTPLEQCIAEFMAKQKLLHQPKTPEKPKEPVRN